MYDFCFRLKHLLVGILYAIPTSPFILKKWFFHLPLIFRSEDPCIISMTITCFHDDCILFEKSSGTFLYFIWKTLRHFSLKLPLHSSNWLTIPRTEMKLGAHVCYIVSMTTTTTNSLRHFCLKLLLHSSNLLTAAHMEVQHGMHIISMWTTGIFSAPFRRDSIVR